MERMFPKTVRADIKTPLKMVGEGNYRKLGFKIYHASLWTPDGTWNYAKTFALNIQYSRDLSKDTLMDAMMDDIREQGVADDATFKRWQGILSSALTDIKEDDTIIALSVPGKKTELFYNGTKIISIDESALSDAFFNIWFGPKANSSLREKLIGQDN